MKRVPIKRVYVLLLFVLLGIVGLCMTPPAGLITGRQTVQASIISTTQIESMQHVDHKPTGDKAGASTLNTSSYVNNVAERDMQMMVPQTITNTAASLVATNLPLLYYTYDVYLPVTISNSSSGY